LHYEFYISTKDGDDCWHWDLKQYQRVISDFVSISGDDTSRVEIQRWFGEGDFDYVEVYPKNETAELPKYVQKYTDKVIAKLSN